MSPRALGALALASVLAGCGDSTTGPTPDELPAQPIPLTPTGGVQATSDTPTFSVRNAKGFDLGQAQYTIRVFGEKGGKEIASVTVPASRTITSTMLPEPLPRSLTLTWNATAMGAAGSFTSASATFRTVSVDCVPGRDPFAKSVVDSFVPTCSLAQNLYNDPAAVLGPPDAGGTAPNHFHGFMSLGEKGYVTLDMEGCAVDGAGADVRVFQSVSGEPVMLYASGRPNGPFALLDYRKYCGNKSDGLFSNHCDFDLGAAGLEEARYFRIEDGEQYPCPGDTVTEGADIDAIQILREKP